MNVFQYLDSGELLKAIIEEKQRKFPSLSLRSISQKMGLKSSGYLSMLLRGERRVTINVMEKLLPSLALNKNEEAYIFELVRFCNAKKSAIKERAFETLKALRYSSKVELHHSQSEFYSQWYYGVLRELVHIQQVTQESVKEISEVIQPHVSPRDLSQALRTMEKIGILYKDSTGVYHSRDKVVTAGSDFDTFQLQQLMKKNLELAAHAIDSCAKEKRELSSLTLSINKKSYVEIRRKLANVRREILTLAAEGVHPTDVYQLNMQFFPFIQGVEK